MNDTVLTLRVFPDPFEPGFIGTVEQLPGCVTQGDTADETMVRLLEATSGVIEAGVSTAKEG